VKDRTALTATRLEKYAKDLIKKMGSGKPSDKDIYDLTIIAYALALAERSYADVILTKLDSLAEVTDGQ
jgi:hypothetical protein